MTETLSLVFTDELPFSDTQHLYSHLNYLFRTDRYQKWTNEATEEDLAWLPEAGVGSVLEAQRFGVMDHRQESHDACLAALKAHFATGNLASTNAYRNLFMARIVPVYTDEGGSFLGQEWYPLDTPDTIAGIWRAFVQHESATLFCMAAHLDQEEPNHLHLLFGWDGRKPRGISRIDAVLAPLFEGGTR